MGAPSEISLLDKNFMQNFSDNPDQAPLYTNNADVAKTSVDLKEILDSVRKILWIRDHGYVRVD